MYNVHQCIFFEALNILSNTAHRLHSIVLPSCDYANSTKTAHWYFLTNFPWNACSLCSMTLISLALGKMAILWKMTVWTNPKTNQWFKEGLTLIVAVYIGNERTWSGKYRAFDRNWIQACNKLQSPWAILRRRTRPAPIPAISRLELPFRAIQSDMLNVSSQYFIYWRF